MEKSVRGGLLLLPAVVLLPLHAGLRREKERHSGGGAAGDRQESAPNGLLFDSARSSERWLGGGERDSERMAPNLCLAEAAAVAAADAEDVEEGEEGQHNACNEISSPSSSSSFVVGFGRPCHKRNAFPLWPRRRRRRRRRPSLELPARQQARVEPPPPPPPWRRRGGAGRCRLRPLSARRRPRNVRFPFATLASSSGARLGLASPRGMLIHLSAVVDVEGDGNLTSPQTVYGVRLPAAETTEEASFWFQPTRVLAHDKSSPPFGGRGRRRRRRRRRGRRRTRRGPKRRRN